MNKLNCRKCNAQLEPKANRAGATYCQTCGFRTSILFVVHEEKGHKLVCKLCCKTLESGCTVYAGLIYAANILIARLGVLCILLRPTKDTSRVAPEKEE